MNHKDCVIVNGKQCVFYWALASILSAHSLSTIEAPIQQGHLMKLTIFSVGLLLSSLLWLPTALAQPDHAPAHGARDKAPPHSSQHHAHRQESRESDRHERDRTYVDLPRINEREIMRILRQYDAPRTASLPPGIQRNLERGKPLPPGIARRFDGQLASQLPQYPGYEWEHVGDDVVLIEAATRVVVDVLVDALR